MTATVEQLRPLFDEFIGITARLNMDEINNPPEGDYALDNGLAAEHDGMVTITGLGLLFLAKALQSFWQVFGTYVKHKDPSLKLDLIPSQEIMNMVIEGVCMGTGKEADGKYNMLVALECSILIIKPSLRATILENAKLREASLG